MKYVKYETKDNNKHVGVLERNNIHVLDYSSIIEAINHEDEIDVSDCSIKHSLSEVKILPPTNPSKIVCIGLNYKDHADEFNMELPKEPLLFIKPSTSVTASGEHVLYPDSTNMLDFEGELGIVILNDISKETIINDSSFAFTIINDVTARDLQKKDGQWTRAKGFDTFCPVGPVVVTNIDSENLKITSTVNGVIKQNSNTKNMIFKPLELVRYISNIMTLKRGDLIATGTPPGVDHVNHGDTVTITIENIGSLSNIIK